MTAFSAEHAAAALIAARKTRKPLAADAPGPRNPEEAFAVQDLVSEFYGPPARAWKVGGGGTAAPVAIVHPSPCAWPSRELFRIGIEAEIAVLFGEDVGSGTTPVGPDEIAAAIASVHAAIEIVDSRLDTWPVPDPLWALADNQNNGGLVYATEGRPWTGRDLSRAKVELTADGATLFSGDGVNPGGDPLTLLVWLAGHLSARTGGIKAGTIVTTGSLTGVDFVEPGSRVTARIADFPPVDVTFPA